MRGGGPASRVWIPKPGIEEQRPLSIPALTRLPPPTEPDGGENLAGGATPPTRVQVPPPASDRPVHRRFPPGRHVLAFVSPSACAEASLVVEIDGDSHAPPDQADYEAARTRWLEERGYRVIRPAAAQQVEDDLAGVVEGIRRAYKERAEEGD